jgi:DNA-binding CsgD family transcriptional regulator
VRGYIFLGGSIDELRLSLTLVHLGEVALGRGVASRIAGRLQRKALTRREIEVLGYVMGGLSNKAIAAKLTLAVGTIKTHVKSILEKLDARSRTQAAAIAQGLGMIPDEEFILSDGLASGRLHQLAAPVAKDGRLHVIGTNKRAVRAARTPNPRGRRLAITIPSRGAQ